MQYDVNLKSGKLGKEGMQNEEKTENYNQGKPYYQQNARN